MAYPLYFVVSGKIKLLLVLQSLLEQPLPLLPQQQLPHCWQQPLQPLLLLSQQLRQPSCQLPSWQ